MQKVGGAKLMTMSKDELATFFGETVGEKLGADMAKTFRKASLSHKQDAMKQWAKKVLTPAEAKEVEKIANDMQEDDDVFDAIDGDVIEKTLGVQVTAEEVDTINKLTEKMFEAGKKEPDTDFSGYHTDFYKAQKELNDYLDTVNPMNNLSILSRIIFRGNLLFAPKSIVTNVVGNLTGGVAEKLVNTMQERKAFGVNTDLIAKYRDFAVKTYYDTGIDVVRAMEATGASSVLGEHFQGVGNGKGVIRAYGRFVEQYVLKLGQGLPDVVFASLHFADNVNVLTTKYADAKGLTGEAHKQEARRMFKLVTSLRLDDRNPDHAEALEIKRLSVQHALTATYQNDTTWSKNALAIRNAIDEYTGDLALGTNVIPFVKTLVNIAKLSIDMTGLPLVIDAPRLVMAYKRGDWVTVRQTTTVAVRAGLGVLLATLLASLIDDDDYLPDYLLATSHQRELAKLANAPYNSIRIGDKWVSLVYFGTFGYVLAGMLGARQQQTYGGKAVSYTTNTILQLRQTPVVSTVFDVADYISDIKKYNKTEEEITGEAIASTANFFISRTIPAIVSDIAKGVDDKERYTRYGYEGIIDQIQNRIPLWREVLPPKYNALGDTIPTEAWYWIILAGARFKSAPSDTEVYNELVKLSVSGEEVSIRLDGYQDVKLAKEMLSGKEYNELFGQLQKELTTAYANTMSTTKYKKETDPEKKKSLLMNTREGVVKKVMREAGIQGRINALKKAKKA